MPGIIGANVLGAESPQVSRQQILGDLADLDPGWVLLFQDGLNLASDVRAQHPDAIIIGRLYVDQETPVLLDRPEEGGHQLARMCLQHPANAVVNGWQGINEPDTKNINTVKRAATLDLAFATDMLAADRWAGIGAFAIGHPVVDRDIRYWIPALRLPNSILLYHAYRHLAEQPEWSEFRYRLWGPMLADADVTLRIFLAETGHEPGGWRHLGVTEDNYVSAMTRWADEWRADGILGTALFCLRHDDARHGNGQLKWLNWDILGTGLPRRLGDYNRANPWPRKIAKYPKEEMMTDYDRDQVWVMYQRKLAEMPMFSKVAAKNRLGDPIEQDVIYGPDGKVLGIVPHEFDRGQYRFGLYPDSIVWAKIGDWANTKVAYKKDDLPPQ